MGLNNYWAEFDGIILENMHFGREQVQRALRLHGCSKSVASIRRRIEYHKDQQRRVLTLAPQMLEILRDSTTGQPGWEARRDELINSLETTA